jgi:hypothetical protein
MRPMLILGCMGILSTVAWTVSLDAQAPGHGSAHGSRGQEGLEGEIRHSGGHTPHIGTIFAPQPETQNHLFPGEPEAGRAPPDMFTGGPFEGGPEHLILGHLAGLASHSHPHGHAAVQVVHEQALSPDATVHSAGERDHAGAATAQPDPHPTASPSWQRPPGAVGPGRRIARLSGPGLPGPGRTALAPL